MDVTVRPPKNGSTKGINVDLSLDKQATEEGVQIIEQCQHAATLLQLCLPRILNMPRCAAGSPRGPISGHVVVNAKGLDSQEAIVATATERFVDGKTPQWELSRPPYCCLLIVMQTIKHA